jgi:hypothetical protein
MGWPQITMLTMMVVGLICTAALDGEAKTGKHSFAVSLCGSAFSLWLLWSGGFFS